MSSRALYFECFAGISGDMCLAALINMGVPKEHILTELTKLGIDDEYHLELSPAEKLGIHGLRVDVRTPLHQMQDGHHGHSHHDHHDQRDYKSIQQMIDRSALDEAVKRRAGKIFAEIARAEAIIHNMPIDSVHFHEVGAVDSIIDIVGAAIGIEYLVRAERVDRILCSPLELGSGMVTCAHGTYPVPAPATAEILNGVPFTKGGVKGEATTPTGAAIMKACVDEFATTIKGSIVRTVYGIGHRDADIPNVVRLQLIEQHESLAGAGATQYQYAKIEANIDDMSPEAYEPLFRRLFDAGASDVFLQSITMKKSRPAQLLCVLCRQERAESLGEIVLNHSSTIGLRILPFRKMRLKREISRVPTSAGEISVKIVIQPDGARRFKSEHDEIAQLSEETGESYLALKRRLDGEIETYLNGIDAEKIR